ncbi:MAG: hypothetical protein AMXMBFR13_08730 [Phycisphaerae bacterium]
MSGLEALRMSFLPWLAQASLQAALLALLVLALTALLRRRLEPGWQYLLWMVVIVRLALPTAPQSRWSVHNALRPALAWSNSAASAEPPPEAVGPSMLADGADNPTADSEPIALPYLDAGPRPEPATTDPRTATAAPAPGERFLWRDRFWPAVWLTGALGMAGYLAWAQFSLWRAVSGRRPIIVADVLRLLEDCKDRMGVKTFLALIPTDRLTTPALFGLIRPKLLIPADMIDQLSREELRHIFLHELAHLRRMDIHVGWLMAGLQVLHWFNPLVWLAFARLRTARELACDRRVLAVLDDDEPQRYGRTILTLFERWARPCRLPGLAGILEESSQLKRRITMIASYRKSPAAGSAVGLIALAGLVLVGLTNAQTPAIRPAAGKEAAPPRRAASQEPTKIVGYVDDTAEGRRSIGASGHAVQFDRPAEARFVTAVEIHAARYGTPEPPKENFYIHVLNGDRQVLARLPFSYSLIERGDLSWYTLKTPSIEVPEKFYIAPAFNPHQTKGIYLGYDESVEESHSFVGLPGEGYDPVDKKYDWMVRVHMTDKPGRDARLLADWKPPRQVNPFAKTTAIPEKVIPSQEKQSYGGRGPAIDFQVDAADVKGAGSIEDLRIKGFSVFASRYGSGYDPETTMVKVAVLNSKDKVVWEGTLPYAAFTYKPQWVSIVLPEPVKLSSLSAGDNRFRLALDPEATRTRGIYWHYQKNPKASHSFAGTLERGFQPTADREWLMRMHVAVRTAGATDTQPADAK